MNVFVFYAPPRRRLSMRSQQVATLPRWKCGILSPSEKTARNQDEEAFRNCGGGDGGVVGGGRRVLRGQRGGRRRGGGDESADGVAVARESERGGAAPRRRRALQARRTLARVARAAFGRAGKPRYVHELRHGCEAHPPAVGGPVASRGLVRDEAGILVHAHCFAEVARGGVDAVRRR